MNGTGWKIGISGSGVAGPALAYWLLRCGHRPTLIEQAPRLRSGGYVIDFWGVGYEIAQRMGIEPALRHAGYQVRRLDAVDCGGRVRASMDMGVLQEVTHGRFTSLPRSDVSAAIHATIESRVETLFGDSIASVDAGTDGVRVELKHGGPREFDLLIGADGLHSNVRQLVFGPDESYEKYLGCRVAACVIEGYRPRDELVYITHNVPDKQVARFTLREDRTLVLFVFRSHGEVAGDAAAYKAILRREFADAGWECPAILAALDTVDELYFDVVSQIHIDRWSRGRVALIGDAPACISLLDGEGSGLAITEAYVMAGELHRACRDWRVAFERFESRLRPFIHGKQASAERFLAFFTARTRLGIWLRNQAIRSMGASPLVKLFAGRSLRDDFELPDYGMLGNSCMKARSGFVVSHQLDYTLRSLVTQVNCLESAHRPLISFSSSGGAWPRHGHNRGRPLEAPTRIDTRSAYDASSKRARPAASTLRDNGTRAACLGADRILVGRPANPPERPMFMPSVSRSLDSPTKAPQAPRKAFPLCPTPCCRGTPADSAFSGFVEVALSRRLPARRRGGATCRKPDRHSPDRRSTCTLGSGNRRGR